MFFTYLYLMRVPALCGLLLAAFPLFALSKASSLLIGMYDLMFWRAFVVAGLASLLAVTISVCIDLVFKGAEARFSVPVLPKWFSQERVLWRFRFENTTLIAASFAAFCAIVHLGGLCVGLVRTEHPGSIAAVPLAAVAVGVLAWRFAAWWWDSPAHPWLDNKVRGFFRWSPIGYYEGASPENNQYLLRGHSGALLATIVTLIIYGVFGISKYLAMTGKFGAVTANNPLVPTLGCVLLLLTLACWVFAEAAFFLDRFRIPFVFLFALIFSYSGSWVESDHTYKVLPQENDPEALLPETLIKSYPSDRLILVAASGGGIQATAWTGRVLGGLFEYLDDQGAGDRFAQSIRLISSVSGGSVGSMYFIDAYRNGTIAKGDVNRLIYEPTTRSSLDEIAWGLAYPDLFRLFVPTAQLSDRGWAAEHAWTSALPASSIHEGLRTWRKEVRENKRPAILFNATLVDTGARLILGTADFAKDSAGRKSFYNLYRERHYDLPIVTAARLSATFPYVSPAARPDDVLPKRLQYHAVDGGYFDNYGVATLADWLREALKHAQGKRILVMQIRGPLPVKDPVGRGGRGFFFQLKAPATTLLNLRGTSQIDSNDTRLKVLEDLTGGQVSHEQVAFDWPEDPANPAPLSWHLTEKEKRRISEGFASGYSAEKKKVLDFLQN